VGGLPGGVVEAGIDVGFFQIREVLEDFLRGHSARKQLEDLAHCDSHPADRGLPAADIGTDRDSLDQHASIMLQVVKKIKGLARFNSSGGGYAFAQALKITPSWAGEEMAARTSIFVPHRGQVSGSSSHVRAMSRAQSRLRLRVNGSSASSAGGRDMVRLESGGGGEGGGRRSFSSPFPAGPTEEEVFARWGGRLTGGSWIHPAFLRNVVEAAP